MHYMTSDPRTKALIDRARAERDAEVRGWFVSLFTRKPQAPRGAVPAI